MSLVQTDSGTVVNVSTATLGDELASAHAAGVTVLSVKDASDFSDAGGWLQVGTEVIYYTSAADDEATDTGVLTLATATTSAYTESERVLLYPPAYEKTAEVMVGDFSEAMPATVPHTLWDKIADGVRADGEGEVVTLTLEADEFVVSDVVGSQPLIDGSLLDPDIPLDPAIVPPAPPPTPTAPASSPTPEVIGGIGALFVRWAPISTGTPPIDVEVHLSPTTPVAGDATTLAATVQGTQVTLRTLADGTTPLSYVDANGDPVVYHVALRAKNSAGSATLSAEDSGSMMQVTGPDIAAAYVYAGNIVANQITGGRLDSEVVVGGDIYAEGAAGERVSLSGSGFTVTGPTALGNPIYVNFPTDGAKPNIFSGTVEANTLEVGAGATLRSTANMVASQAALNLSSGVLAPQSPPATDITWPTVNIDTATKRSGDLGNFALDPAECYGLAWTGTYWLTVQSAKKQSGAFYNFGFRVWRINTDGSTAIFSDNHLVGFSGRFCDAYGVTYIGATPYYLVNLDGSWELWKGNNTSNSSYTRVNTTKNPALGTDGTNLLVAESVPASSEVRIRVYSTDNLGQIDETITTSGAGFADTVQPAGIARGTFDYGVTRIVITWRGSTDTNYVSADSTGVVQANESWPRGPMSTRGFGWDGANFWGLSGGGKLYKYTTLKWTTESSTWWVGYTWTDTNATGGTHETNIGTKVSFTMKRRAQLKVTTNAVPSGGGTDDPNNVSIYIGRGAGTGSPLDLARTSMWRQSTSGTTLTTFAPVFSGTNPPAVNNFPSTAPGKIASSVGSFSVDGNSNGSIGTGTFRDSVDARVTALAPTPGAWTAYTPTFAAGTTNPTLGNFTRTGRYLQVGKRVDFVIVITCNTAAGLGAGAYEFGLPVAARDANEVVGQGMQTGPNQPYVLRGISTTAVSAYLTDTRGGMSSTNSAMAVGTVVRLSGTYEAA